MTEVLEHVLGKEGGVGSHHPGHGVEDGEESLERLHTLCRALLTLKEGGRD